MRCSQHPENTGRFAEAPPRRRVQGRLAPATFFICVVTGTVLGQQPQNVGRQPDDPVQQAERLMQEAKKLDWNSQIPVMEDAADNFFQQQGWNTTEDQWARQVMRDVGRIPPWQPMERQEVFLNALQSRWSLTHDQRSQLSGTIQRESMMLTFKHIKDIMPVMTEAMRTRAEGRAFTPDQVQQWTTRLKPLMDEGFQVAQRVGQQLQATMTDEQRKLLQADLAAFNRRHEDFNKMAQKWQSGQWDPTDWGLQNDPVHASAMQAIQARDAQRTALVEKAQAPKPIDEAVVARQESEWDKYVRWFCQKYECDDRQRKAAEAILKSVKTEAINYRNARGADIEKVERRMTGTAAGPAKVELQADLDRLTAPITGMFERMKRRLHAEVLTTEQRKRFGDEQQRADGAGRRTSEP